MLADVFAGSVGQFYTQQARNYALGAVPQMAKTVDRGDHQIRYVANQGQETVTLKVHPKRAQELLEKKQGHLDWALIEINVPNAPVFGASSDRIAGLLAVAQVVTPLLQRVENDDGLPFLGINRGGGEISVPAENEKVLFVPYPDPTDYFTTSHIQRAMFELELTPLAGVRFVEVDLWAVLLAGETIPGWVATEAFFPAGPDPVGELEIIDFYGRIYSSATGFTGWPTGGPPPPIVTWDSGRRRWLIDGQTHLWRFFQAGVFSWQSANIWNFGTEAYYDGPTSAGGTVRGETNKGRVPLSKQRWSITDVSSPYYAFANEDGTDRTLGQIKDVTLQVKPSGELVNPNLFNRFEEPYLGRVTIDREKGSLSFNSA